MMTSAAGQVEDYECSVCRDVYEEPQILKCGHSFCTGCVKNLIQYCNHNRFCEFKL